MDESTMKSVKQFYELGNDMIQNAPDFYISKDDEGFRDAGLALVVGLLYDINTNLFNMSEQLQWLRNDMAQRG